MIEPRRDPFGGPLRDCDTCHQPLTSATARQHGRCATCREAVELGVDPIEHKKRYEVEGIEQAAVQLDGKPWWKSNRSVFVCGYAGLEQLNAEAGLADGWQITSIAAMDGHTNVGRMMVGAALAGVIGAAAASSRTEGSILVAWARTGSASASE